MPHDHQVKLDRAQTHMDALKEAMQGLLEGQTYEAVIDYHVQTGENVVRLGAIPHPPPEISAIVGDVLFNLRSSLDHCVYALSVRPGKCKEDRIAFPIVRTEKRFLEVAPDQIGDIPPEAQAEIERLQPYHGRHPDKHPLFLLHELNRIDKHRILNTVLSITHRADALWQAGAESGIVEVRAATAPPEGFVAGAEIGRVRFADSRQCTEMDVKFVLARDIWFGPGPAHRASVFWLLGHIVKAVREAVVVLEPFLV